MPQHPGHDIAQRITLQANARPMRRGIGEVQFGLTPGRGIVMAGLTEAETGWLLSLGGATPWPGRTRSADPGVLLASAASWGVSPPRALELLEVLHTHGLVVEESTAHGHGASGSPSSRPKASDRVVCVLGRGEVPDAIRAHIALTCTSAVSREFDRAMPPDVTVIVVRDAIGPGDRASWARSAHTHLPVVIGHRRAVLGPVISNTAPGPCLTCLDLTRRDRDTAWPMIAAQIGDSLSDWGAGVSSESTLTAAVASLTAMLVRAHLDDVGVPSGVTWEVALPWPDVTTRLWPRHLACTEHD
ncbi:MAG: hypothetical protein WA880_08485 [Ornithinimicrobium sp.]